MKFKYIVLCAAVSATLSPLLFAADHFNPKIDPFVQKQMHSPTKKIPYVFVVLNREANLAEADMLPTRNEKVHYVYDTLRKIAIETQAPLVKFLQTKKVKFRQYYIENMIGIENPSSQLLQTIAARSEVKTIKGNPLVRLKLPQKKTFALPSKTESLQAEGNLVSIGATKVWGKFKVYGQDIVIAGQDTGVQWDHPALIHQYRGYENDKVNHHYNWHDAIHGPMNNATPKSRCGYDTKAPCDDYGHGTHTIGTIVGDDGERNQIGVAPKAKWIACKNMDNGIGSPASYIECFEFFLAPYPLNGNPLTDGDPNKAPHIVNNSWGCAPSEGCKGDEILPSLIAMKKAGILVVASAGNDGPRCATINTPPAYHTGLTFSVGAFDHRNGKIASFSSRGPSSINGGVGPNITAPGVSIRSSVPGSRYEALFWSGTSMAGPHVVGAAALLWSANKNLIGKIDETIAIFTDNAEAKTTKENCGGVPGTHIPNNTYGSGLLNVWNAVCKNLGDCTE